MSYFSIVCVTTVVQYSTMYGSDKSTIHLYTLRRISLCVLGTGMVTRLLLKGMEPFMRA